MPNHINAIPDFSGEDSAESVIRPRSQPEESVEDIQENQESGISPEETTAEEGQEVVEEEKETPSETSTDDQPTDASETPSGADTGDQGLLTERQKLLAEIRELRSERRRLKENKPVEEHIDDLKDIHPEDQKIFERMLRAKGVVTREQAQQMFYDAVKDEEINKFLEEFPEYKPENDPNDLNWTALQDRVLNYFRMPDNPHKIHDVLKLAHQTIARVTPSDQTVRQVQIKQQQRKVASVGAGGVQRSSAPKTLDSYKRNALLMGGWSEAEIKELEKKL